MSSLTYRSLSDSFEGMMDHLLRVRSVLFGKLLERCTGYPTGNPAEPWDELDPVCARNLGKTEPLQSLLGPFNELVMHAGYVHAIGNLHDDSSESPVVRFENMLKRKVTNVYIQPNFVDRASRILQHTTNITAGVLHLNGMVFGNDCGGKVLMKLFAMFPPFSSVA